MSIIVKESFKYEVNVGPNVILNKLLSMINNSHSVFANVVSEYLSSNNKFLPIHSLSLYSTISVISLSSLELVEIFLVS